MNTLYRTMVLLLAFMTSAVSWAEEKRLVGGDLSMLPAYEQHNSPYLDENGRAIDDLLLWLRDECGWNAVRVRLFVNPVQTTAEGVIQDIDYVKALGKRIKDAGMTFMLDFHYSDTWADPVKQYAPAAWSDCNTPEEKAQRLYEYTKESLQTLIAAGAEPDYVQVGNEITSGIVGVWLNSDKQGFLTIVKRGCEAVREVCPQAKIVIHTERPNQTEYRISFYKNLDQDLYDVIGLSYYPFWHDYLPALGHSLNRFAEEFPGKEVQIVETAYYFQYFPTGDNSYTNTTGKWAATAEGQYAFIADLIDELQKHSNVNGLYYWFPEEAGCGDDSDWNQGGATVLSAWVNRGMWWEEQTQTGHWPVVAPQGFVGKLLGTYASNPTGVEKIRTDVTASGMVYDLQGRSVNDDRKGIVVRDKKKIVNTK